MVKLISLVALGGAIGSVIRYLSWRWIGMSQSGFPLATFLVNLTGCLLIGILWALLTDEKDHASRLFAITGFLGGFTTFSSFAWESFVLVEEGRWKMAIIYIVLSNLLGITLAVIGFMMVQKIKQ